MVRYPEETWSQRDNTPHLDLRHYRICVFFILTAGQRQRQAQFSGTFGTTSTSSLLVPYDAL